MTYHKGNLRAGKATLYLQTEGISLGNIVKVEVREVEVLRRQWAQYPAAVSYRYKAPRQRNWRGSNSGYRPYLVVLAGWGHPDPQSPWETVSESPDVTVSKARHSGCSDGWTTDFDGWLSAYLAAHPRVKVLGDYRHTTGCDTYNVEAKSDFDAQQGESVRSQLVATGVDADVAAEAARLYVAHGAPRAAAFLCNEHDVMCTTGSGYRCSVSALVLSGGVVIEPEEYFAKAS